VIPAFVPLNELFQKERHVALLQVAAAAQLMGNIALDILLPLLGGVETDHADRVLVLPFQHIMTASSSVRSTSVSR